MEIRREHIPWAMAAGRALLGPVVVVGEKCGWSGTALAVMVLTALVSDIFDGVLARRWKCDTAGVRLFDTIADTVFYVSAGMALWVGRPEIWRENAALLAGLLGLEVARWSLEFVKFGKPASYHSYLAKFWGLVLASGIITVFATQRNSVVLEAGLALGIVSNLEGFAMSLVLPVWTRDVKGLRAALQVRGSYPAVRAKAATAAVACVVLLALAAPASATEPGQAAYVGGSAPIANDTSGTLDTVPASELIFRYRGVDGRPAELAIPYGKVRSFEMRNDVVHHLGVLPAIAVGLVAARQRKHTVTISYADTVEAMQVAIFQVPAGDVPAVEGVLKARAPQSCVVRPYLPCGAKPGVPVAAAPGR